MPKNNGFSLIELLIVVTIITVLAAIAIPNLVQSRKAANEASAIASIRNLVTAEVTYAATVGAGSFASLAGLRGESFIDDVLGAGQKDGYSFTVTVNGGVGFTIVAVPNAAGTSGTRGFFGDESGVIRYSLDGTPPDGSSPALGAG